MKRMLALTMLLVTAPLRAAEVMVEDVRFPAEWTLDDGQTLQLNGAGLRAYGLLRFKVYVAGLYLPTPAVTPRPCCRWTAPGWCTWCSSATANRPIR